MAGWLGGWIGGWEWMLFQWMESWLGGGGGWINGGNWMNGGGQAMDVWLDVRMGGSAIDLMWMVGWMVGWVKG